MKIIAMIPARMGSERLQLKNLALLNEKPLISYAIEAAKASGVFDKIIINSDGELFSEIASRYEVDFSLEPSHLGSAQSDDVVYDFLRQNPCDVIAWVNPISPLQTSDEISRVVNHFLDNDLDTLITVKNEQVHCVYENSPINFSLDGLFAKTQDLVPVQSFVYSIMMWKSSTFIAEYDTNGHAILSGKIGYYPVSKASGVIIKTSEDLLFAENILKSRSQMNNNPIQYDEIVTIE